ncbi:hypothetical protein BKA70DRAFT_712218 [Coprinopsis sp. MPI-PUGE-AT-0042]|nr:hypothetical protein BKA70DRAFT_712218 [Coprinopsis sp. MPI-PUGE-AT-0042]
MSKTTAIHRPYALTDIDRNTTLCLACSCSLPPFRKGPQTAVGSPLSAESSTGTSADAYMQFLKQQGFFITPCCNRPICPTCVKANPRLTRYNPCLACLAGVDAVGKRISSPLSASQDVKNIDGAVRDEDTYVVGEDDDDDDLPPPAYSVDAGNEVAQTPGPATPSSPPVSPPTSGPPAGDSVSEILDPATARGPSKYFLNKRDTLQGLALRFGVDARELCRLNKLPISALNTTPHILHTRSYIILPLSAASQPQNDEEIKAREAKRAREKAERKLQTLMKEADPSIAKAYVALIDDDEAQEAARRKRKEMATNDTNGSLLEAAAIDQYLEDEDWEINERRQGRNPTSSASYSSASRK